MSVLTNPNVNGPGMGFDPNTANQIQALVSPAGIGLASNRMRPPAILRTDSPYQCGMGTVRQIAMADITAIMISTASWYLLNGVGEQAAGTAMYYTAGVRDRLGNKTQITWGGAGSITQADNTNAYSDWITLPRTIRKGEVWSMKTFARSISGIAMPFATPIKGSIAGGDACQAGSLASPPTDLTMSETLPSSNVTGFGWMVMPSMVYAKTASGAVICLGTSICVGQTDNGANGYGTNGRMERAVGKAYPVANLGFGGGTANVDANIPSVFAKRLDLISQITVPKIILSEYSTNDLAGSRTSAQLITDLTTIKAAIGPCTFIQGTCLPRTDAGNTTANATVQPKRITFNAAVLAMGAPFDGYWDENDFLESAATPGLWASGTYTADGTHPEAPANLLMENAGRAVVAVRAAWTP